MTQEEAREALKARLIREKQCYIAKATGIDKDVLSKFKLGKIENLYPQYFQALEAYLLSNH